MAAGKKIIPLRPHRTKDDHAAMNDLAGVCASVYELGNRAELLNLALAGACASAAECLKLNREELAAFFEPVLSELGELTMKARWITRETGDVGQRIHHRVCRS